MPKGLFSQLAMVIVSVAIIYTYIIPAFNDIKTLQEDVEYYDNELKKVTDVRDKLSVLKSKMNRLSSYDMERLERFLPKEVDTVSVMRDISLIVRKTGLVVTGLEASESKNKKNKVSKEEENLPTPVGFSLAVSGEYEQHKYLLDVLSRSEYPLEISSYSIASGDGEFMDADIDLVTYQYNPVETVE